MVKVQLSIKFISPSLKGPINKFIAYKSHSELFLWNKNLRFGLFLGILLSMFIVHILVGKVEIFLEQREVAFLSPS